MNFNKSRLKTVLTIFILALMLLQYSGTANINGILIGANLSKSQESTYNDVSLSNGSIFENLCSIIHCNKDIEENTFQTRISSFHKLRINTIVSDMTYQDFEISAEPNSITANTDKSIALPIIMYHSLVKDKSKQNQYFIPPSSFESDLKYIQDNGYTTVTIQDLIDYTNNKISLPNKPIMLTFDDGFYNNYLYGYFLLREYDMKAVISPVGKFVDDFSLINDKNEYYANLTWRDINEMIASDHIEIQNHTYNLHSLGSRKGANQKKCEKDEIYKKLLTEDLTKFQETMFENTGKKATAFAYPYGAYNKNTSEVAKELGFASTLTCVEKINYITHNPESLYELGRYLRPLNMSSEEFFKRIENDLKM